MILSEYQRLGAELAALQQIYDEIPTEHAIDRLSIEKRIISLRKLLNSGDMGARSPTRARLAFRGKPVIGSHGVFAEFGAAAVSKFADAIAAIAANLAGPLGARGVLPNRESHRMLIIGTLPGSFGFELEEHKHQDELTFLESSPIEQALDQARTLMQATGGSDDDLAEAASGTDPRAIAALREFVKTMAEHEAVCSLEFGEKEFHFSDVGQVRRSAERLSQDNIHEEVEIIIGTFQGVLPKRRTFEFKIRGTDEVIAGKVGSKIVDTGEIRQLLECAVRITVVSTRVGNGRPRYQLLSYEKMNGNAFDGP